MKPRLLFTSLVLLMMGSCLFAARSPAGQFTADMIETRHGTETTSRIAVKDNRYRISTRGDSQEVNVIVDESLGKTWVLVPSRQIVLEKELNDPRNLAKNPFQAFRYMAQKYGSTQAGQESVSGYECARISVSIQGQEAVTAWVAETLGFPVKIVNHVNQRSVVLSNIREEPVDDGLFKVLPAAGTEQTSPAETGQGAAPTGGGRAAAAAPPAGASTPAKQATAASGPPAVIFILDASGSMWGRVHDEPKITIAKSVMSDLIDQLPANMHVGLMAYGHRRKGDCRDIEMLVPVGRHDAATLKARINALNPKGKTPLSAAVVQAAKNLHYREERATVVLVSDGLETCNADPCRLAEKLAMQGVDFTVHVIGFDLSKAEQARLRCLADKTGGLFLAASDAGALRSALLKTVEKVKQPPPVIREAPGKATLEAPDAVPLGSTFAVKWQGPDSIGDYIAVSRKGSKDTLYEGYAFTKSGNPVRLVAPGKMGAYELRYVHAHSGRVIGRRELRVTPVDVEVSPPNRVAAASEFDVKWEGPAYASDMITLARPDQAPDSYLAMAYTHRGNPARLRAPADPGSYEVRYILGHEARKLAMASLTVQAVSAKVTAPASVSAVAAFEVQWQGPAEASDLITIARPDQTPDSYLAVAQVSSGNPVRLRAPADPGTYEVRYILGHGAKLLAKTSLAVTPVSAKLEAPTAVNAASEFEIHWQGPGNTDDLITIARPDQDATSYLGVAYVSSGNPVRLRAPADPGTYEVRYILGHGAKLLTKTPLAVTPVSASIRAPASVTAGSRFEVHWQGPGDGKDMIMLATPGQDATSFVAIAYVYQGNPVTLTAPKNPGTYEVRYILFQGAKLLAKVPITVTAP